MRPAWLTRNVAVLSLTSLLNDVASEIIAPLLPLFLTVTLGGAPAMLGLVEGTADTVASLLKLYSGRLSDRLGKRKPLVVLGYSLSAVTRLFLALAGSPWAVLAVRTVDRVGKGLRTSPRDAMLAEAAPPDRRGTVYGFHRAMDHLGAVLGALIAWLLLSHVTTDLRTVFLWSAAPAFVAVSILALFARDSAPTVAPVVGTASPTGRMRWALVAIGILGLGQLSDAFLLLKAGEAGVAIPMLPLLWMAFHMVKVVASLGAGALADRIGRRTVMATGWVARAAIYGAFALTDSVEGMVALFVVYGVYHGLTEGAEKALISELAAKDLGTAFGWYNLVAGVAALPAGLLLGGLWTLFGAPAAFACGAALAIAALVPLAMSSGARREVP